MMMHGHYVVGRKPEHEVACVFPCKVAAAGNERYFVCAAVAAGVVWFLLCVLQQCLCLYASFYTFLVFVVADRIGMAA